jgi:hypothetical protein
MLSVGHTEERVARNLITSIYDRQYLSEILVGLTTKTVATPYILAVE